MNLNVIVLPDPRNQTSTHTFFCLATFTALDTNYQPRCSGYGGKNSAGTVGGAKACLDFLNSRGGNECVVSRQGTAMCNAGGTVIYGLAAGRQQTASSACRDVAYAVKWVLDHCSRCGNDGCSLLGTSSPSRISSTRMFKFLKFLTILSFAGSQAAWANGDLIVVVGR